MARELPSNPLAFIRACIRAQRIFWTYHVNMRLVGRFIPREVILAAVDSFEIVEAYPEDKYLPSYLVLARPPGDGIHVLFAADVAGDNVRVVTAYRPNSIDWEADLRTRRVPS